jgi:polysaccharide biosynthesis/export protein ExoF
MKFAFRFVAALAAVLAAALPALAEYRLGAGDELRLIVADQPQVSGNYAVSDDGSIFVILGGRIPVGGLSIEAAAAAIRERLSKYIVEPSLALEVSKYRPFYVLGDVASPGIYPSAPGMTAMKAIAAAGGLRGRGDRLDYAVTGIRASESYLVALKQQLDSRVQKARLQAELDDAPSFDWDAGKLPAAERALLGNAVSYERQLFEINRDSFQKQTKILRDLIALRTGEVEVLQSRYEAQERQTALLRKEIERVEALLKNGVATISQRDALSREETRSVSEGLQIRLQQNQAQQGLNQADLQLTSLIRDRRAQILDQIAAAGQRLQRLGEEIRAAEALMLESDTEYGAGRVLTSVKFTVRGNNGTSPETAIEETYVIQPGDIVTVRRVIDVTGGVVAN